MATMELPAPRGVSRDAWQQLTRFQQHVYRAVARIPKGQTRSYQWVAQQIGRPHAARAVGNALHGNPFLPLIPCHRVTRADGTLGGYARGLARKQQLLRQEGWGDVVEGRRRRPRAAARLTR